MGSRRVLFEKPMIGKWPGRESASIPLKFAESCYGKHLEVDFVCFEVLTDFTFFDVSSYVQ